MPTFIISGSKEMKDGNLHVVCETAPSLIRAEWIRAQYVAEGYSTIIKEEHHNG